MRTLGQALTGLTRDTDAPARWGDESFAVVVPSVSPDGLKLFAERLRWTLSGLKVAAQSRTHSVTVSIGGAFMAQVTSPEDGTRLLAVTQEFLQRVHDAGGDSCQVCPQDALEAAA